MDSCVVALEQVAVAVESRADRGVTEPLLYIFLGFPTLARENRRTGVAKVMEAQTLPAPGPTHAWGGECRTMKLW